MGKHTRLRLGLPLHFFRALLHPACFTTEQSTVEASLFVHDKETSNFAPRHRVSFKTNCYFQSKRDDVSVCCSLIKHAKISQSQSLLEWFKLFDWLDKVKAVKMSTHQS